MVPTHGRPTLLGGLGFRILLQLCIKLKCLLSARNCGYKAGYLSSQPANELQAHRGVRAAICNGYGTDPGPAGCCRPVGSNGPRAGAAAVQHELLAGQSGRRGYPRGQLDHRAGCGVVPPQPDVPGLHRQGALPFDVRGGRGADLPLQGRVGCQPPARRERIHHLANGACSAHTLAPFPAYCGCLSLAVREHSDMLCIQ